MHTQPMCMQKNLRGSKRWAFQPSVVSMLNPGGVVERFSPLFYPVLFPGPSVDLHHCPSDPGRNPEKILGMGGRQERNPTQKEKWKLK